MNELFTEKEKNLLDFTIDTREKLIQALTGAQNNEVPEKSANKILLNSLLDGLDKAIHTKAKLSIEDKQTKQQEEVASLIGDLLNKIKPREYTQSNGVNLNVQELDVALDPNEILPGEGTMGGDNITFDSFYHEKE